MPPLTTLLYDFLLIFVPLFVAIDPAGMLPLFLALTEHHTELRRRAIARRATVVAAITGVTFVIVGQSIFAFLGIRFADFQIAGGILLVVLAIIDLLSSGKPAVDESEIHKIGEHPELANSPGQSPRPREKDLGSIGVIPLAVPLIVGPATMTTSLLLVSTYGKVYTRQFNLPHGTMLAVGLVCLALLLNLALLYIAMRYSGILLRLVSRQTMAVINKIVMILLAAIAVSLIRQGITSIITDLR